ncbi:cupin domain-containing protein [Bremerella cremea]|uniref:cupin domain-containing protein n=1 Tax=Bremerella cremea TaxID=1031537 RepID=UPI0031E5D3FD
MTMQHPAKIVPKGHGPAIGVLGDRYRVLVTGEETGGQYAMVEAVIPPGGGPPPHIHSREEEGFYVLEGEVTFVIDDQKFVAGPGTFLNLPIGSLHYFTNRTEQPARMIFTMAPAGLEQMFLELGSPLLDGEMPEIPTEAEILRVIQACPRFGIEIVPPS